MQGRKIQRSQIVPRKRAELGMYAQVLAQLLDLKRPEAYEYPCRDRKHAYHIARSVSVSATRKA